MSFASRHIDTRSMTRGGHSGGRRDGQPSVRRLSGSVPLVLCCICVWRPLFGKCLILKSLIFENKKVTSQPADQPCSQVWLPRLNVSVVQGVNDTASYLTSLCLCFCNVTVLQHSVWSSRTVYVVFFVRLIIQSLIVSLRNLSSWVCCVCVVVCVLWSVCCCFSSVASFA